MANVITVDDGEVEVYFRILSAVFRSTFKVKDMVFDGKLEM